MTYNTNTHAADSDRVVLSLFAAGIMFVAGYTAVRVSLSQAESYDPTVQTNVIPHEGELWSSGFENL